MKLICPSCGATNSAESWVNDALARQCLKIVGDLPYDVSKRCLAYISMFRSDTGKSLAWVKALRLLAELQTEVGAAYIQWDKKVARPNTAVAWGTAMERVIEHPPKSLPLKSHGYLKAIAYEIADDLDKKVEYAGGHSHAAPAPGAYAQTPEKLVVAVPERRACSLEEMRRIRNGNKGTRD
jgi:hypothetical protein